MGSLSSTPKVPQQQVVFVPAPTASPSVSAGDGVSTPATPSSAEVAAQEREKSLLSRKRGRLGTIATGFQGLLGEINSGGRKTLLGE